MVSLSCSHCGKKLSIPEHYRNTKGRCAHCGAPVWVPPAGDDLLVEPLFSSGVAAPSPGVAQPAKQPGHGGIGRIFVGILALFVIITGCLFLYTTLSASTPSRVSNVETAAPVSSAKTPPPTVNVPVKPLSPTRESLLPTSLDDRAFTPGTSYVIEREGDTVRYAYQGSDVPPQAYLRVYLAFSSALASGAMVYGRAVARYGPPVGKSSEVAFPLVSEALLGAYTEEGGRLAFLVGSGINQTTVSVERAVTLISGQPCAVNATEQVSGPVIEQVAVMVVATAGQIIGISNSGADFHVRTNFGNPFVAHFWKETDQIGAEMPTPEVLSLGDIVNQDVVALSNVVEVSGAAPPSPAPTERSGRLTARAESAGETRREVEVLPDGSKRLVLKGDPEVAERSRQQWQQMLRDRAAARGGDSASAPVTARAQRKGDYCEICGEKSVGLCHKRNIYVCEKHRYFTDSEGVNWRCP